MGIILFYSEEEEGISIYGTHHHHSLPNLSTLEKCFFTPAVHGAALYKPFTEK